MIDYEGNALHVVAGNVVTWAAVSKWRRPRPPNLYTLGKETGKGNALSTTKAFEALLYHSKILPI